MLCVLLVLFLVSLFLYIKPTNKLVNKGVNEKHTNKPQMGPE